MNKKTIRAIAIPNMTKKRLAIGGEGAGRTGIGILRFIRRRVIETKRKEGTGDGNIVQKLNRGFEYYGSIVGKQCET